MAIMGHLTADGLLKKNRQIIDERKVDGKMSNVFIIVIVLATAIGSLIAGYLWGYVKGATAMYMAMYNKALAAQQARVNDLYPDKK